MRKSAAILAKLALGVMLAAGSATVSMANVQGHGSGGHGAHGFHGHRTSAVRRADNFRYPQYKSCSYPYHYDFPIYCH